MQDAVITVENLSKSYLLGHNTGVWASHHTLRDVIGREARNFTRKAIDVFRGRQVVQGDEVEEFWALKNVSFEVKRGEVLGIIGRNGAGKSTLLKILSRIAEPTRGRVTIRGRVASLLEVGTGFHPELTGRENIYLNGAILGMTQREIRKKFDEIVAFAEVEQFLDTPVKRFSSGMYVRLAFAVAAHLDPEVLLVDEVLSVGDAAFQKKCLGKMSDVATQGGRTVLFVSHNMLAVRELCKRVVLLEQGTKRMEDIPSKIVAAYLDATGSHANIDLSSLPHQGVQKHIRFLHLSLLDAQGQPTTAYVMNEPFAVRLELECKEFMAGAEIGVKISSRFGQAIHCLTSSWEGFSVDLDPGIHVFEVTLPHLLVYPGTYVVGVWVAKDTQPADAHLQEITSFTVIKGNINGRRTQVDRYAYSGCEVYAPCTWKRLIKSSRRKMNMIIKSSSG
jgi:homopolymeric O-antigen transport system ATP-binding protein